MKRSLKRSIRYIDSHSPFPVFYPFMMTKAEKELFDTYVKPSSIYLEFGAGGTTLRALQISKAKIFCVESSEDWMLQMKSYHLIRKHLDHRLHFHKVNIGPTKEFGYPIDKEAISKFPKYSSSIFSSFTENFPDTILIDGRFRVACAIKSIIESHQRGLSPVLLFHDFWDRPQYHPILEFVDVIERIDNLAVFRAKTSIQLSTLEEAYNHYNIIPE